MDEWIKLYTYTQWNITQPGKEGKHAFMTTWMDLEGVTLKMK